MKKRNLIIAIIIVASIILSGQLSSCCKTVICNQQGSGSISFVNFLNQEASSFYIRRYQLNTNFTVKIDTMVYSVSNLNFERKGDTLVVTTDQLSYQPPKSGFDFFIESGYDYEIVLPVAGRISRITDVKETRLEEEICGFRKPECRTVVKSLKVDGVLYAGSAVIKK